MKGAISVRFTAGEGRDKIERVIYLSEIDITMARISPELFASMAISPQFAKFWEAVVLAGITELEP